MNLKLAKMIRRMAKDAVATMEEQAPVGSYRQHKITGAIHNAPNSLRGVYRRIRKEPSVRAFAYQIIVEQRKLRKLQKLPAQGGLQ